MDFISRQRTFLRTVRDSHLDGFIVTHAANVRYLCGYTGSNGLLLFLGNRPVFFTDGRYTEQAKAEVEGARTVIVKVPLLEAAGKLIGRLPSGSVGFEADYTSVSAAQGFRKVAHKKISWKPTSGLIMRQRLVKDGDELKIIREAIRLGANSYNKALRSIRVGVREAEVAGRLEFAARQGGADGMSFDTIVAGGKRGALPHGRASSEALPRRGFVVVDSGVVWRGYCSDMTRTVHLGRANAKERGWYSAVLEAQLAGIAAVKAGAAASDVDHAARAVLRRSKLDGYFTHSTGHGVGLEIHEPPRLGKGQVEELLPGMVITIEPGIYIPGEGGIRIEDMVLVTESGCEVLTPVSKELVEI
jgi:Xaa-Pro aminopeptidase